MIDQTVTKPLKPVVSVEFATELSKADLNDLCDATDEAIKAGGGFGWVKLPARDILERYWQGVLTMPARMLFVARLDGVICGTAQLILPPKNNEAQSFAVNMTTNFVAPWARKHGLARMLMEEVEKKAREAGFAVINLDVRETQEEAIRFYESVGYIHFGTHPYYARVNDEIIKGRYYYKVLDPQSLEQDI
ncbi:MAG TPA: GNAT family N-acetyltransferase [Micavibrio sp.]|nr:GNAT family N-acetyltransferase [Pseudomonadota bacterium]MEC8665107.1 GNAT family N-acetyltransferase [Pseudomonadota bacterium]HIF25269.1 GNAT family N-acetyltransferase [Micavibrio sp.]HIL28193.1 GNAT family N-acetyltransferase [Micavibrio sp.]